MNLRTFEMFYNWSYEHLIILSKRIELGSRRWNWKFREKQFWNPKSELLLHSSYIIEHSSFIIELRGILNLSAKSIRRRICHVKAYAWNVNFSAFAIEELFRIKACQWRQNALKFKFRCTKIYVLTRDQYISVKISSNWLSRVKT